MSIEPHPHQPGEDPEVLIDAIAFVMGPKAVPDPEPLSGGGWISGSCRPARSEQVSETPDVTE